MFCKICALRASRAIIAKVSQQPPFFRKDLISRLPGLSRHGKVIDRHDKKFDFRPRKKRDFRGMATKM